MKVVLDSDICNRGIIVGSFEEEEYLLEIGYDATATPTDDVDDYSGDPEEAANGVEQDHVLVGRLSGIFCCCSLLLRSLQRYTRASNSLRFSKRAKGLVRKFKNRRMDVSQECSDTLHHVNTYRSATLFHRLPSFHLYVLE